MLQNPETNGFRLLHGYYLPHLDVVRTVVSFSQRAQVVSTITNVKDLAAATKPAYLVYSELLSNEMALF